MQKRRVYLVVHSRCTNQAAAIIYLVFTGYTGRVTLHMLTKKVSQARRRLLKFTGCSLLAGVPGLAFGHTPHTPLADSLRAIGEAYLDSYPAERSRSALLGAIRSRSARIDPGGGGPTPAVLNRLVIEDFGADDVVYLNGWALSRTEARVAALTVV